MTVMLTSMGVLFVLVIVARLRLVNVNSAAHTATMGGPLGVPAAAFGAPPPGLSANRLTMSFGAPTAPLFGAPARPDAAAFA